MVFGKTYRTESWWNQRGDTKKLYAAFPFLGGWRTRQRRVLLPRIREVPYLQPPGYISPFSKANVTLDVDWVDAVSI